MLLYVRNMESDRCISTVKHELERLGLVYTKVELGEVEFPETISEANVRLIDRSLRRSGLELLENKDDRLVTRIKEAVSQFILLAEGITKVNLSDHLRKHINYDYASLSNFFSEKEAITIEKYFIDQRIERAKDMLTKEKLAISEIAYTLQFSNIGHFSNQFKQVTGLSPTSYRQLWYSRQHIT